MAKDSSFDIVSEVNMQELDNAYQQAKRELKNRYDLKDTNSEINLDKQNNNIEIKAPSDFVCSQIKDIVLSKCIKRNIDLASLNWSNPDNASGGFTKLHADIIFGIDKETASKINKSIKSQKFKVKTQIEGDKIRVSSPKKDILQDVIKYIKEQNFEIPLQFVNYR